MNINVYEGRRISYAYGKLESQALMIKTTIQYCRLKLPITPAAAWSRTAGLGRKGCASRASFIRVSAKRQNSTA